MLWGYFLYQGVIDPLGGIWTLWPLFGTANQMLAAIALTLCTVVLFKMKRQRYAWVTIVPATWLVVCTVTAGLEKVFSPNPAVGFVAPCAAKFGDALGDGKVLAPAKIAGADEPHRVQRLRRRDARRAFAAIVVAMVVYGVIACRRAMGDPQQHDATKSAQAVRSQEPAMTKLRRMRLVCDAVDPDGTADGGRARLPDLCRAPAEPRIPISR